MSLKISKINIGKNHPPFIIAEMSGNHNQSLKKALKIVKEIAKTGAHAIKLQTYTPDTITIDCDKKNFIIKNKKNIWSGQKLYDLYKKAYTPWDWHKPIMKEAKKNGLVCFSTPFDMSAIDFLEDLKVPAYKIASFENNDLPLIERVAKTGKPIIVSLGMASLKENTVLKPNDPLLFFIQRIRDEAHRFAITAHRHQRKKNAIKSFFDDISGIGPKRKKILMLRFGTIDKIRHASYDELNKVQGITNDLAKKIYGFFHNQ